MKEFIKNIPVIGPSAKAAWALLRINRFVQALQHQQDQIDSLRDETIATSNRRIQQLETELGTSNRRIQQLETELGTSNRRIQQLETELGTSNQRIQQLETELGTSNQRIQQLADSLIPTVERQLFHQALALQQRIDQFVFDARQTLLRPDIDDQEKLSALLAQAAQLQERHRDHNPPIYPGGDLG